MTPPPEGRTVETPPKAGIEPHLVRYTVKLSQPPQRTSTTISISTA